MDASTLNTIMMALSGTIIGLLVIGFLIGVWRGWKKSLARFIALLVILLIALFLTPVISSAIINACTDGTTISIFGFTYDFQELVSSIAGSSEGLGDIVAADGTTTELAFALMNVAVNVVLFVAMFLVLSLLALFVHFIVFLVLRSKAKKNGTLTAKKAANRLIGGGIGFFSMIIICFTFLIPVFGVMNICNTFITDEKGGESANASVLTSSSIQNYLGANLYYTEDENIGTVETYVETYAKIKENYDKSPMGVVFNALGISKLGSISFNYLTSVKSGDLEVNVTNEIVSVIKVYNEYKETFVANKFDITNNNSVDGIISIYDVATTSKIVQSYIIELLPKLCENWENGEAFLGIEPPVSGEMTKMFNHVLEIFKTDDINRISNNLKAVMGVVKVANNNNLISTIQAGDVDVMEFLAGNETFVKDAVLQLSTTPELRSNLPIIINDALAIGYKSVVGEDASFSGGNLTSEEIAAINWNSEADVFQKLVNTLLSVFENLQDDGSASESSNKMLNELSSIGEAIDLSRNSVILSDPMKEFITGFINTENVSLSLDIKSQINGNINNYWASETYSFKAMFKTLQETASLVDKMTSDPENVTLENIKNTLITVAGSQEMKDSIKDLIGSDIVDELVPEEYKETASAVTEMFGTFIDEITPEKIEQDIAAADEIINIINVSQNHGGNLSLGETEEEKKQAANNLVETIANSSAVMAVVDAVNTSTDASAIKDVVNSLGGDVTYIQDALESEELNIPAEAKDALANLFGRN